MHSYSNKIFHIQKAVATYLVSIYVHVARSLPSKWGQEARMSGESRSVRARKCRKGRHFTPGVHKERKAQHNTNFSSMSEYCFSSHVVFLFNPIIHPQGKPDGLIYVYSTLLFCVGSDRIETRLFPISHFVPHLLHLPPLSYMHTSLHNPPSLSHLTSPPPASPP